MRTWDFVLRLYANEGVEPACLTLQDDHGQCVPLLLWRAWTLAEARAVDDLVLAAAVAIARTWHAEVIEPIRAVRRRLKAPVPPVDDDRRLTFRQDIARRELNAERLLIDTLETLARRRGAAPSEPLAELGRTAQAWGRAAPEALLARLLAD